MDFFGENKSHEQRMRDKRLSASRLHAEKEVSTANILLKDISQEQAELGRKAIA